ncbi:hypothetical protein VTN77DRAFT_137 [Rasamsonia byssochlamydoides]|uniref:uncharacterized protein n=1 Tax=Rasamsonia byssochlamydoides TaxID=89139 RepID=UPI0037429910
MSDPFFADRDWLGRVVSFSPAPSDSWRLEDKLSEKVDQKDEYQWHVRSKVSVAWATFACSNEVDGRAAIMKVRMQIPYKGTGHSAPNVRAEQASRELGFLAKTELNALRQLTQAGCSSAPRLLSYKQEQQTHNMSSTGGVFLAYGCI